MTRTRWQQLYPTGQAVVVIAAIALVGLASYWWHL